MDEVINEEMGAVASEALAEAEALKADLILAQAAVQNTKHLKQRKSKMKDLNL